MLSEGLSSMNKQFSEVCIDQAALFEGLKDS